jgi:OmcA/MtrC family decaheme c-type cytochrome
VLKDGSPVTFNATGNLITGVDGSPGVYVMYATTQDGIATPADWNGSKSASMKTLRDTAGAQTGPDASGYYTATIPTALPADAKMVTAAIGIDYNGFVQLNHADYPKGIRLREPAFVMKTADGYTARRSIVDNAKCNNCHGQLGVSPSFHSGARNNGQGCATGGCHDANKNTGHTGGPDYGGGWSVAAKNLIHGIHGKSKREKDFTYEATSANPKGFGKVTYPGVLKDCETCHVSGGYDFSSSAAKAAAEGGTLLWTTDAKTDMTNAGNVASIGLSPWVTTTRNNGQADYRVNHLVSSPIASSCFGCHDSNLAVQHMESNGGTLVRLLSSVSNVGTTTSPRPAIGATSTMAFNKTEQCMLCHAVGKVADIKAMHAK